MHYVQALDHLHGLHNIHPFTVIKNGKFSTIIPYGYKRVRLCHCCIPFNFLDFKDLKKLKKANEGRKGQMKGQNIWNTNFLFFFVSLGSFGGIRLAIPLIQSSKVKKAKKATS